MKYMNEKELLNVMSTAAKMDCKQKIKYHSTLKVDNLLIPIFTFISDDIQGYAGANLQINNFKIEKFILITTKVTENDDIFNSVIYHEAAHHLFTEYSDISRPRISTQEEELLCDYYSYLKCGNKFFSIEDIISPNRIRFLNKIIKRNIDFMNLLNTVKIRYNTIIKLNRKDYRLHIRITRKFTTKQRYRIIKSERDLIKKYFDQIL